jgi:ubiquinone/menaquinone biosynthesis C-methylase UbiE
MTDQPPVCDYEGSNYRTRFWENQGRDYEDRVERIALRRLMPPSGDTLIDIGAGFGRLSGEYDGYRRVVLFDYSRSLLREAQERLGDDPRFIFVAGDWYRMPFVAGLFETLVQVRTIHHAADVPALFRQLARIALPGGSYILEFASKRHLKSILRYWAGRQKWSPFQPAPVEFAALNFDFHPRWIQNALTKAGFDPGRILTVSHYRLPLLKRIVPLELLVKLDSAAQLTGGWWQLTPSVFVASQAPLGGSAADKGAFFACPECQTPLGEAQQDAMHCPGEECGRRWRLQDGLYDFKEPF